MRQTGQVLNVQILRAFAAALVVFGHASQEAAEISHRLGVQPLHTDVFNFGWGVDIFFVISGFIMVRTSANQFGLAGAGKEFMVRRLIRILPLYWLITTALIVGAHFAPALLNTPIGDWPHVLASYLFIPDARFGGEIRPVVALGWTLNYEMFFYIFFALFMAAPLRGGLIGLASLFFGLIAIGLLGPYGQTQIDFWTSPMLAEFLMGIGIGVLARQGFTLSLPAALAVALAACLLAFALGPAWTLGDHLISLAKYGAPAALLVGAAVLGPDAPALRAPLALGTLGDASYALYLAHPFAIRPLRNLWINHLGVSVPIGAYFIVAMAAAIIAALMLHFGFERPATNALNGWRRARRQQQATGLLHPAE